MPSPIDGEENSASAFGISNNGSKSNSPALNNKRKSPESCSSDDPLHAQTEVVHGEAASTYRQLVAEEQKAREAAREMSSHLLTEEETASEMVKAAKQKQRAILVANARKLDAALEKADECLKSSEKELEREFEDYFRYVSLLCKKDDNGQDLSLSSLVSKQEGVEENTANADGNDESCACSNQNRKVDDSSQMPEAKLAAEEKEK